MSIINELNKVFRRVFEDEALEISPQTVAHEVPGWDSFSHATLLMAVEDHFGIEFEGRDVANLQDVGDLLALIETKLNGAT